MKLYCMRHGQRFGPYTIDEIAAQGLEPDTLVWGQGMKRWLPARQLKQLQPLLVAARSEEPPPLPWETPAAHANQPPPLPGERSVARALSPWLLLGLGVIFTPLWTGGMLVWNRWHYSGRVPWMRLGAWISIVLLSALWVWYSQLPRWSWAVAAGVWLGLLAVLEAWPQARLVTTSTGSLFRGLPGWSILAGTAGSALMVASIVLLRPPPTAREVCERYCNARTPEELQEVVTERLWLALADYRNGIPNPDGHGKPLARAVLKLELLKEEPVREAPFGLFIAFRLWFSLSESTYLTEGAIHLVQVGNTWKVEEEYLSRLADQPFEEWVTLTELLAQELAETRQDKGLGQERPQRPRDAVPAPTIP